MPKLNDLECYKSAISAFDLHCFDLDKVGLFHVELPTIFVNRAFFQYVGRVLLRIACLKIKLFMLQAMEVYP